MQDIFMSIMGLNACFLLNTIIVRGNCFFTLEEDWQFEHQKLKLMITDWASVQVLVDFFFAQERSTINSVSVKTAVFIVYYFPR